MSTFDHRVTYVVLDGGKFAGLYNSRPVDMAMGAFQGLLPIVVTCARRDHAEAIEALWSEFAKFSHQDAHALAYSVQESSLDIPKTKETPIYGIRKGVGETGIWVGFKWDRVSRHVGNMKGTVFTGQFDNIKEAIIYMLDKPGYNFPLRSGNAIPRPTTTLPFPQALAKARASASGPVTPSKRRFPSPNKASACPDTSARPVSRGSSDDSFATARGDATDDLELAMGSLAVAPAFSDDDSLVMQVLAQFIARPTGMRGNNDGRTFRFPITFGERADEFLALKMPTAAELWTVLQVRVHTRGVDAFVHHLGVVLGHKFNAVEARTLYSLIAFPCV